jgi:hypothetical protein
VSTGEPAIACRTQRAVVLGLGMAAAMIVCAHGARAPSRSSEGVGVQAVASPAWVATPASDSPGRSGATHAVPRAAFWFGLLSLAVGVALVERIRHLRPVRIGGPRAY